MANQQQLQNLGNAIGYIAVADINGLRNLLSRYGVVNVGSDSKTLIAETTSLVSNSRFYNELVALIQKNVGEASFSGYNSADGKSGGFFGGFNLGTLLNTGASVYQTIQQDKAQKDLLNAQANQQAQQTQGQILAGQLALEQEKLKLAQIQAQNEKGGGSNTLLYVGLGLVGLIVVGGVIYAVTKK